MRSHFFELFMPAIDDVLSVATAAFAVAAWVVPPIRYVLSFRTKPRDSLSVVGRVIGLVVLAAILSAVALVLALLTLVFSERSGWGWFGLGAIGAYWLALVTFLLVSDHLARRRRREPR
jgi:uncharacterized membrane protein YbhN (UPF0104 family)